MARARRRHGRQNVWPQRMATGSNKRLLQTPHVSSSRSKVRVAEGVPPLDEREEEDEEEEEGDEEDEVEEGSLP